METHSSSRRRIWISTSRTVAARVRDSHLGHRDWREVQEEEWLLVDYVAEVQSAVTMQAPAPMASSGPGAPCIIFELFDHLTVVQSTV